MPRFRPRAVHKMVRATEEMEQRRHMLSLHAIVITEEGPLGVQFQEEVNDLISHHFGIHKHFFLRTCLSMYFIKRKIEYNTTTVKKELSQANHTTKAKKNKREESSSRQTPTSRPNRLRDNQIQQRARPTKPSSTT
jgi:hypothetical protein